MLRHARREALVVLFTWLGALAYTVLYCKFHAYGRSPDDLKFVLGFPDWVFWGVLAPWALCFVVALWFAAFFMKDDALGEERNDQ